jgi:hypothetical protein
MRALYLAAIGLLAASPAFAAGFSFPGSEGTQALTQGMTSVDGQASFHGPVGGFAISQGNAWSNVEVHPSSVTSQVGNGGFSAGVAFGNGTNFQAMGLNQAFAFTASGHTPVPSNWNNPFAAASSGTPQ